MAKMLVPETEACADSRASGNAGRYEHKDDNFLAAIARGTTDGLNLAMNVGGDADCFSGADRADQRHSWAACIIGSRSHGMAWFPSELAADFWLGVCAGGVGHRGAVAGMRRRSATCSELAWWSTNWWRFLLSAR